MWLLSISLLLAHRGPVENDRRAPLPSDHVDEDLRGRAGALRDYRSYARKKFSLRLPKNP